jgi:3-dehydroquinate dehydratase-2
MPTILVLHGPNLNLLGKRNPTIYGSKSLDEINKELSILGKELNIDVRFIQSNHEGELIDALQDAATWAEGVMFNPGGYTHTSVALRDAIDAIDIPVIEVHISNVYGREEFRQKSLISPVCRGKIVGFGWKSYLLGLRALTDIIQDQSG